MEEVKKETKKVTKKTTKKETKKVTNIKNELKKNSKEIEVEIMNITNGGAYYRSNNGNEIDIDYPGDTIIVSLKDLEDVKTKRAMLEKMYISICEVFSDDYTVDDILKYLNLDKFYKDNHMTLDSIDEFLEESNITEFERILKSSEKAVVRRFAERAVRLVNEGKFGNVYKRECLQQIVCDENLFGTR